MGIFGKKTPQPAAQMGATAPQPTFDQNAEKPPAVETENRKPALGDPVHIRRKYPNGAVEIHEYHLTSLDKTLFEATHQDPDTKKRLRMTGDARELVYLPGSKCFSLPGFFPLV